MHGDTRSDDEIQLAARCLFEGVVPERSAELIALWEQYQPKFHLRSDAGFVMAGGLYRDVEFNHRALRAFWLAAFIAWEGYMRVHEEMTNGSADFDRFDDMVDIFSRILDEEDPSSVLLPQGVSEPGHYPDAKQYPQEKAAADLATFATGWAFLHEIRHIKHQQDGTGAASGDPAKKFHEEEFSCDEYATTFILDGVDQYAGTENVDSEKVRQKRELGIYFSQFAMTLIGPRYWGASYTHPSMQNRIDATIKLMGGSGTRTSDVIAQTAFAALRSKWPDAPGPFRAS